MQGRATTTAKALIIGIDQYGGPPNDLTSCTADADAVARLLEERYGVDELHTLNDDEATLARVEEELEWLAEESRTGDRRLLYFSGHGGTRLKHGVMEECLVLHDGLLETDHLVARLAALPSGALTVILDASFTGGPETYVQDPTRATAELELVRTKTWVPVADESPGAEEEEGAEQGLGGDYRKVTGYRRFGCAPTSTRGPGALDFGGLLVTASHEGEPAVANTSKTSGLSAFTHALLQSIEQLGVTSTATNVLATTAARLRALGVRQTPRLLESPVPGDLRLRRFLTLDPVSATESLRFMSEPRFWEGVLAAGAPQPTTAWAVSRKEDDLMSTAFQPMTGGYQSPFGTTQQSFGGGQQLSPEELQRVVPAIAPVLATVIPALVPAIVNAIVTQQRNGPMGGFGLGGAAGQFGFQQPYGGAGFAGQYGGEQLQQVLPILAPVLANVIPNIVPQIVQAILTQRQQTGWGGGTPSFGAGGGAGFFGGGQDLWQTVSQSVNEALQRIGLHQMTPATGRV
ncbi:MAG TPA: caspase family protein [Gemmatimonadaceae bacterium]|nr:caspase family protein [Gemmatimonadaceae bacterium]